jgi:MOSC domain-containing protein YiiM
MDVVSVNVGVPREVEWRGKVVSTGIFKQPVDGPVAVRPLNLDGDRQADLSVHGGPAKAVYAYRSEHYEPWRAELSGLDLAPGAFGENLTLAGLPPEEEIGLGDRYRVGTAGLVVTQPRLPCFKLGIRFGRADMVKRFLASRRTGWYFAVEEEGEVAAGDPVELVERDPARLTVADVTRLYAFDHDDTDTARRLAELDALPEEWRAWFAKRLDA